jgi:hypothetical protein
MIKQSLPDFTRKELVKMLENPKYVECCMVKTPLVMLKRNHKT